MTIKIQALHGPEAAKSQSTLFVTSSYPNTAQALTALVPMPPGWHYRPLQDGYAVYFSDDDHCLSLDVIVAQELTTESIFTA